MMQYVASHASCHVSSIPYPAPHPLIRTPKHVTIGLAANLVARDVLDSISLEDARRRASLDDGSKHASGQHLNIGNLFSPQRHLSIETSATAISVLEMNSTTKFGPPSLHVRLLSPECLAHS